MFFDVFHFFSLFSNYCGVEFGHGGVPLASLFQFFHYQGPSRPLTCTATSELRDFPLMREKVVMDRLQEFRLKRKGYGQLGLDYDDYGEVIADKDSTTTTTETRVENKTKKTTKLQLIFTTVQNPRNRVPHYFLDTVLHAEEDYNH